MPKPPANGGKLTSASAFTPPIGNGQLRRDIVRGSLKLIGISMDAGCKVDRLVVPVSMGDISLLWLGIDVGGTFTDLVVYDPESGRISLGKVPSTPEDQSKGILDGIVSIGIDASLFVRVGHGSTVATNTALERSGAEIAVLVTAGHRDILITGRGNRTLMYNIKATAPTPIVARDRCFFKSLNALMLRAVL